MSCRIVEQYLEASPPFDLRDRTAVREYHSKLEAARHLAELHPLETGHCLSFHLTIPPANPLPNSRPLPHLPRHPSISFWLAQSLQCGPDKLSQVWTAGAEFPDSDAKTTVVLKMFQPSMGSYPDADSLWHHDYVFSEAYARDEAWVYNLNRLEHKQGLSIPYFFGLHTIITPSNELAWVLVLEYIPGGTLRAYIASP
ncbi:hypothetical protein DFH07DRAFT_985358 [Mycena maculata]|uniref:Uncharacterized protein n=1 Tax=Mycena maculata TaxID=230809 RepID=A0AAD7MYH8_9AGAR|nr:hypothetical protein DFH07DRAFT_985358 [Mycena maculata]